MSDHQSEGKSTCEIITDANDPLVRAVLDSFPGAKIVEAHQWRRFADPRELPSSCAMVRPFASFAADLHAMGWAVIPQQRYSGRMPAIVDGSMLRWKQWKDIGPTADDISYWREKAGKENIAVILGPPSGNTFCIDIDVLDGVLSAGLAELAVSMFGATIRRYGERPRVALLYRADPADLPRNRTRSFVRSSGEFDTHKLEVHCRGKLITVSHLHHRTGFPFEYHDEKTPWTCRPEDLPLVSSEQLEVFFAEAEKLRAFSSSGSAHCVVRAPTGEVIISPGDWIIPPWRAEVELNAAGLIAGNRWTWLRDMSWDFVRHNAARIAVPVDSGSFEYSEEGTLAAIEALYEYADKTVSTGDWHRDLRAEVERMVRGSAEKLAAGQIDYLPTPGVRRPVRSVPEHQNTEAATKFSSTAAPETSDLPEFLRLEDTGTPGTPRISTSHAEPASAQVEASRTVATDHAAEPSQSDRLLDTEGVVGVLDVLPDQSDLSGKDLVVEGAGTPAEIERAKGVPGSGYISFGQFHSDHRGVVCLLDSKGDDEAAAAHLCGPVRIVALSRQGDGTGWGLVIEILNFDRQWRQVVVPRDFLAGSGEGLRALLMSMGFHVATQKRCRDALMAYFEQVSDHVLPRRTSVSSVGWHGDEYVSPGQVYTQRQTSDLVLSSNSSAVRMLEMAGSLESWQENVGRFAVGNSRLMLVLGAAFAAPLLHSLGVQGGGVHLRGGSSTGKTTLLRAATSVYSQQNYQMTWRMTDNGLEGIAAARNDGLLVLDEMGQVASSKVGEAVYMLSNGEGKTRASKDGAARLPAKFRIMLLSTGEISLADKIAEDRFSRSRIMAGQEVRLLDLPADTGQHGAFEQLHGFGDGASLASHLNSAVHANHGTAFDAYMRRLVKLEGDDWQRLRTLLIERTAEMLDGRAQGQLQRAAERLSVVSLGAELASEFGIGPWSREEAIQALRTCFEAWVSERGGTRSVESIQTIERIRDFITRHIARFEAVYELDDPELGSGTTPVRDRAGFVFHSLAGAPVYGLTSDGFKEALDGLNGTLAAQELSQRGFLQGPDSAGKWSIAKTVRRQKYRLYLINDSILEAH